MRKWKHPAHGIEAGCFSRNGNFFFDSNLTKSSGVALPPLLPLSPLPSPRAWRASIGRALIRTGGAQPLSAPLFGAVSPPRHGSDRERHRDPRPEKRGVSPRCPLVPPVGPSRSVPSRFVPRSQRERCACAWAERRRRRGRRRTARAALREGEGGRLSQRALLPDPPAAPTGLD